MTELQTCLSELARTHTYATSVANASLLIGILLGEVFAFIVVILMELKWRFVFASLFFLWCQIFVFTVFNGANWPLMWQVVGGK